MKTNNPFLSIIIPVFNEAKNIENVINRVKEEVKKLKYRTEIIIVNDGSTDNTLEVLKKIRGIRIISYLQNRGKGHAMRVGGKHARGRIIIYLDGDGSHDPSDIRTIIKPIIKDGHDLVIGSRFKKGYIPVTTPFNIVGNRIYSYLLFVLTGKYISDVTSGYRAMKKEVFEELNLVSDKFPIEAEMLIKALKMKKHVIDVHVSAKKRQHGHSHLKPIKDGFMIMLVLLLLRFNITAILRKT